MSIQTLGVPRTVVGVQHRMETKSWGLSFDLQHSEDDGK